MAGASTVPSPTGVDPPRAPRAGRSPRPVSTLVGSATDRLTVAGFSLGWSAVRHLPERSAYLLFESLAELAVRRGGKGVRRLRSNYAKVHPQLPPRELDDLVRAGMRSYLRYYCEVFRLSDFTREQMRDMVRLIGDPPVRALLAQGRPVVVFLGHMGNWDLAGAWASQYLAPVTTVAERLQPEEIFTGFLSRREAFGNTIVPLTGGPDPFEALTATVRRGGLVALLADRDLTTRGVEVDFCGHRARMAKGPAALALQNDAALFAAGIHTVPAPPGTGIGGRQLHVTFSDQITPPGGVTPESAVLEMTAACARHVERFVREHTTDWHMLQRVFTDDLRPAGGAHP